MSEPACDIEDLVTEVRELLGKPEPGVTGRAGWPVDPEKTWWS